MGVHLSQEAAEIVDHVYQKRGYLFEWQILLAEDHPAFLQAYDATYGTVTGLTEDEGSMPRKYRECVFVGVLASMGEEEACKNHIHKALAAGATRREIIDAVLAAWNPSGAMTIVHGLKALVEALVERDEYEYRDVPYRVTDRAADAHRTFVEDKG